MKSRPFSEIVNILHTKSGRIPVATPNNEKDEALPVERVDEKGRRFCRHHPEKQIEWQAQPCQLCWKEGSA